MRSRPLANRALTVPHPQRLSPEDPLYDQIVSLHAAAVSADEAGYLDPRSGLFVFTAASHVERGTCCESDCRHCPYVA